MYLFSVPCIYVVRKHIRFLHHFFKWNKLNPECMESHCQYINKSLSPWKQKSCLKCILRIKTSKHLLYLVLGAAGPMWGLGPSSICFLGNSSFCSIWRWEKSRNLARGAHIAHAQVITFSMGKLRTCVRTFTRGKNHWRLFIYSFVNFHFLFNSSSYCTLLSPGELSKNKGSERERCILSYTLIIFFNPIG